MNPKNKSGPSIVANDVYKHYGHVEALQGLSVEVQQGEIFGLIGANGAGKSTLIKILVGATSPTSGDITVLGFKPEKERYALRRHVGYMPQSPALYDDLSPRENIRFFAQAHPIENLEKQIDEVLHFVDLEARQHDPVYEFSGGMKQRLSLACTLVHKPRLLLLDEPSAGVDPKLREAFWDHFRQLVTDGVTIVVSSHQMDEVVHCDRAMVMRSGSALACDTPKALLARGNTKVTLWRNDTPQVFDVPDYRSALPELLSVDVDRIEIEQDSLEDVVLSLINQRQETSS